MGNESPDQVERVQPEGKIGRSSIPLMYSFAASRPNIRKIPPEASRREAGKRGEGTKEEGDHDRA